MFFCCGDVTLQPTVIEIPAGKDPISIWPWFDDANGVGHTSIEMTYVVGRSGVAKGGGIELAFAYDCRDSSEPGYAATDGWIVCPCTSASQFPFGQFQTTAVSDPNFVSLETPLRGAKLTLSTVAKGVESGKALKVTVDGRALRRGEKIELRFGATDGGSPGATLSWHPGRPKLVCWEDTNGSGNYVLAKTTFPELLVTAMTPQALRVDLPVTATVGGKVDATLQVLQGGDSPMQSLLPLELFAGTIVLESFEKRERTLYVRFDGSEHGAIRFPWTFSRTGTKRIVATLANPDGSRGSLIGVSNPVEVRPSRSETAIYCGDLQRHSCEGGHAGVPDYDAWTSLWNRGDDFGVVVEHSSRPLAGFLHAQRIAQQFAADVDPFERRFVAFPGYEWTLPGQHRTVVHEDFSSEVAITDATYTGSETPPPVFADSVGAFLALVRNHASGPDRIAIPHHMAWLQPGDLDAYDWGGLLDDPAQPLVEIFSMHGNSEKWIAPDAPIGDYLMHFDARQQRAAATHSTAQAALADGHRFGFVGGSDCHGTVTDQTFYDDGLDAHPAQYARGGLTFVVGERSTLGLRQRIWDGLRAKRTYVTTGARMLVDWSAQVGRGAKHEVGSEVVGDAIHFHLRVVPSGVAAAVVPRVVRWEVWRDGATLVGSADVDTSVLDVAFDDPSPPLDGLFHPYHAKAAQSDDHLAWASPIWARFVR